MLGTVLTRLQQMVTSVISNVTRLIQSLLSTPTGVHTTQATQCAPQQDSQPAVRTLKQNQTLVDRTKSGKFAAKGTGAVQTPMERQRQADGKFKKTHVGLPHQRVKSAHKKGK